MKLFKNVDVCDLASIFEKGILSLDASGNDNWINGRRAENATNMVYLFKPIEGKANAFPGYGCALLEVNADYAIETVFEVSDVHKNDYTEYMIDYIAPEQILKCYVPEIFKERLLNDADIPDTVKERIKFVEISGLYLDRNDLTYKQLDENILATIGATANFTDSKEEQFMRGIAADGSVIDMDNITYMI